MGGGILVFAKMEGGRLSAASPPPVFFHIVNSWGGGKSAIKMRSFKFFSLRENAFAGGKVKILREEGNILVIITKQFFSLAKQSVRAHPSFSRPKFRYLISLNFVWETAGRPRALWDLHNPIGICFFGCQSDLEYVSPPPDYATKKSPNTKYEIEVPFSEYRFGTCAAFWKEKYVEIFARTEMER